MAALNSLACCLVLLLNASVLAEDPPVALQHRGFVKDKHCTSHSFKLNLSNRGEKPVWFVLPAWGNQTFPKDGIFQNDENQPFDAVHWKGEGGSVIEVRGDRTT